mgnify:CR=1 FL=1
MNYICKFELLYNWQWFLNSFIGLGRCLPGFYVVLDHSTLCRFLLFWQVSTIFLKSCVNLKYMICLPHSHIILVQSILKCEDFPFFQSKRDRFHCRACCLLSQQACSNKFRFSKNFKCWWVQQWSIFVSVSCRSLICEHCFCHCCFSGWPYSWLQQSQKVCFLSKYKICSYHKLISLLKLITHEK